MPLLQPLREGEDFPPTAQALDYPNGLLAVGGDLSPARLISAYQRGIFPWYSPGEPLLWWTPDPRSVLYPDELHVSRSLRKTLRRGAFEITVDSHFRDVMRACAALREDAEGTWISSEMLEAYCELHRLGVAHSVEVHREGELLGGLYGLALGRVFFGESMFSRVSDASKVAVVALVQLLRREAYALIDCQIESAHLNSLGARTLPRLDFEAQLAQTVKDPDHQPCWQLRANCRDLLEHLAPPGD